MYTLIKLSEPGFEIHFETKEDLLREFEKCICDMCFGQGEVPEEDWDITVDIRNYRCMNTIEKIAELWSTACGCEYFLDKKLQQEIEEAVIAQ